MTSRDRSSRSPSRTLNWASWQTNSRRDWLGKSAETETKMRSWESWNRQLKSTRRMSWSQSRMQQLIVTLGSRLSLKHLGLVIKRCLQIRLIVWSMLRLWMSLKKRSSRSRKKFRSLKTRCGLVGHNLMHHVLSRNKETKQLNNWARTWRSIKRISLTFWTTIRSSIFTCKGSLKSFRQW